PRQGLIPIGDTENTQVQQDDRSDAKKHRGIMDHSHEPVQPARGCKRRHTSGVLECVPHPRFLRRTDWLPAYFLEESRRTGLATCLLYSANSLGEQSSSGMSKSGRSKCRGSLFRASHGSVYIFGSVIFMVSSLVSRSTRWYV